MEQWDLNSQPTCMDGPYAGSLDRKFNDQIHVHCANGFKPLVAFYGVHGYKEDLFFYTPSPDRHCIIISRIATFKTTICKSSWNLNTHWICLEFSICNYFNKIPLTAFAYILTLNLSTFSECGYSYHSSKLIIRSLISVFHIGLVIAPRSVVLAFGFASGQYDRPRRNN